MKIWRAVTNPEASTSLAKMDRLQRLQLDELLAEQKALRARMEKLDSKIERLVEQFAESETQSETEISASEIAPAESRKIEPTAEKGSVSKAIESEIPSATTHPPPLPQSAPLAPVESFSPKSERANLAAESAAKPNESEKSREPEETEKPNEPRSFEIQLGTVWLVRIGIVILLTGLVFLGNYAYQNYFGKLGPAGKLALLYFCGAVLTGVGARLERTQKKLRNYARVLMAGGFATIYYTTYGAHFVERLRVIHSPLLAGALLLALAGGIVFLADRKRSQTLAIGAVLLSYYTATINPLGNFTLFSNLLLTGAAVFFLIKNRWTAIPFASLAGTYLSYGYWRFFHEHEWILRVPTKGEFWTGAVFLFGYWMLFTVGALLSRDGFKRGSRAAFISSNNAAFFAYISTALPGVYPHSFWIFSLGFGGALLALAWISNRILPEEKTLDSSFLAQGLLLVTIGLAAKITGYQLALVFALESAALVTCASMNAKTFGAKGNWHAWIFQIAAMLVAAWSFVLAFDEISRKPSLALPLGGIAAVAFLYDARWLIHLAGTNVEKRFSFRAAYFSALALGIGFVVLRHETARENLPPALAAVAFALTLANPLHGLIELTLLAQLYIFCAHAFWFFDAERNALPWWNPLVILLSTLALNQWWQRRKSSAADFGKASLQILYAFGAAALVLVWFEPKFSGETWLVMVGVFSLAGLALGVLARAWSLALAAQLFTLVCIVKFFVVTQNHPHWCFSFSALSAIVLNGFLIGAATDICPAKKKTDEPVETSQAVLAPADALALFYRVLAPVMFIRWTFEYIPQPRQFWFLAFSAIALFAVAAIWKKREVFVMSALLAAIALFSFWTLPEIARPLFSLDTLALLALLSAQRLGKKRLAKTEPNLFPRGAQIVVVAILLATLWLHFSRWAATEERHFFITISWTLLAACIFAAGLALRERPYRLGGLIILGATVARIFFVDVWQLETVYRIVSFILLGVVLLALGFVYNRFAEKFRDWL